MTSLIIILIIVVFFELFLAKYMSNWAIRYGSEVSLMGFSFLIANILFDVQLMGLRYGLFPNHVTSNQQTIICSIAIIAVGISVALIGLLLKRRSKQ